MKRERSNFVTSRIVRGIAAISGGTAIGQVALLLSAPLLSRLYTPEEFAVLTVVTSCAMPLAMVLTLRFESAVPLPKDESLSRSLAQIAMVSAIVMTMAILVAGGALAALGVNPLEPLGIGIWALLVPILALVLAVYRIALQWSLRQQKYRMIGIRNVAQSLSTVAAQVGGGLRNLGEAGLVGGYILGQVVGTLLLFRGATLFKGVAISVAKTAIKSYMRFALALTPAGLINTLGVYAPAVLVTALYGPVVGGSFGFVQRVLWGPVTLLGQAIAQVYLAEVADMRRREDGSPRQLFWKATFGLGAAGLSIGTAIAVGSPWLFELVFGEVWREAGLMASILSIQIASQLIASPLSQTLIAYERIGVQFAWDSVRLIAVAGAIGFSSWFGAGPLVCIAAFSVASTFMYMASWELSRRTVSARQ
ncbi:oligosaccharide flippase family protein [Dietzia sp. SLG510A3-30A2]|nr:oligosaccharide flippase family protein [Dietzia sp. SLG510A3-30A2]